jgi:MFS family permease
MNSSLRGTVAPSLLRSRAAVIGLFFLSGLTTAVWVVSIPAIQKRIGIDHGVLGSLILLLGVGSFFGMTAAGPLIDRIGSRRTAAIGAALSVIGVNLPGLATEPWMLGVALFLFGLGVGSIDVAMNDQAVIVERRYCRPIMSSFHAFFSVGTGAGAILGALIQALELPINATLGAGAGIGLIIAIVCYPMLLSDRHPDTTGTEQEGGAEQLASRGRVLTIVMLACVAFAMMLAEGTANDWSALQAVERLHVSDAAASLVYGAFAVAMTIGRFSADTISHRFGPVVVVRFGSAIAAVGMLTVVSSPAYAVTLIGWVVFGVGLSGVVPQIYTAAGNIGSKNQGSTISRVVGAGYLGLLAGPGVIGWISKSIGLTLALLIPFICCIIGFIFAGRIAPKPASKAPDTSAEGTPAPGPVACGHQQR